MKYLCLDVGERRVGVAIGDDQVRIATPIDVIYRATLEQDVVSVGELVNRYSPDGLVVGLPRNMDDSAGAQAASVRAYGEKISAALHLPLTFWDERLTTVEATERIHAGGGKGKKSRKSIDAIAASVILQDFLDSHSPLK